MRAEGSPREGWAGLPVGGALPAVTRASGVLQLWWSILCRWLGVVGRHRQWLAAPRLQSRKGGQEWFDSR